jgi:hypothetical protein
VRCSYGCWPSNPGDVDYRVADRIRPAECDGDGGHHDTDTTTSAAVASTWIAFV